MAFEREKASFQVVAVLLFDQVTLAGDFSPLEYKSRRSYFWFRSRYGQPFQQRLVHVQRTVKSDTRKESEGFGRLPDMRAFWENEACGSWSRVGRHRSSFCCAPS